MRDRNDSEGGSARTRLLPFPVGFLATALAYSILAVASLLWTRGGVQIATMWPAGGLAVAVLASVGRDERPGYALAVALGSLAANIVCQTPILTGVLYSAANVAETLVAVALLSRCPFGRPSFVDVRQVACFCAISALAAATSTAVASAATGWGDWRFAASWFATDLLGIVLTAPLVFLAIAGFEGRAQAGPSLHALRLGAALAGIAVITALVFAQSTLPVLFLPFAAVIAATYVTGPIGAAAGTLVVALIGSAAIALGHGPTLLIDDGPAVQGFFLQFYLVVLMGCSLSMAALQTTRDRLVADLQGRTRLLFMAERVARIGHWHLDLETMAVVWSDEVFRLYGLPEGGMPSLETAIAAYHEDDRERLVDAITASIETGGPFHLRARIVRPDGMVRHADVSGEAVISREVVRALFGVVQDVTRQVEIERGLEASRRAAEAEAARATALAETDALTGLANRRRVLGALDEAVREAARSGGALSIAMLDVDHFKRVNDTHGHAAGDFALQSVASTARAAVGQAGLVGRLGGEEFIVVLPEADRAAAMEVAERIRRTIEDSTGRHGAASVTVSIGIATMDGDEEPAALMRRADAALYRAKAEGRNATRTAA
ncbi:sensor domain-containing diguanylate cyclase [uncultured Aureimonas sp.]|uniref:sensor domain-containing diguanylate cyclase n=1 Tax=uncultured Aureimonas sp. TaxID=1604662 RepID=UPI0025D0574A|nr:sensor domain-containing diguanylate cyclase [uncultured Aureimonas sp.]